MATNVVFYPWAALKIQTARHFAMSQVHECYRLEIVTEICLLHVQCRI